MIHLEEGIEEGKPQFLENRHSLSPVIVGQVDDSSVSDHLRVRRAAYRLQVILTHL
jgi:hypothetical protein